MDFNLVVPMAGAGSRFADKGYTLPKPLIPAGDVPMFVRSVDNFIRDFDQRPSSITFIIDMAHEQKFDMCEVINQYFDGWNNVNIVALTTRTDGAACTVRAAAAYLPPEEAVVVMNCDQYIVPHRTAGYSWTDFMKEHEAGMFTFREPGRDPKWSYAELNKRGLVTRVAEKDPISDIATVGIYYWSKASIMFTSIGAMMVADDRFNNEFYLCPAFNYTIADGHTVGSYSVAHMQGLGTPEDLEQFLQLRQKD